MMWITKRALAGAIKEAVFGKDSQEAGLKEEIRRLKDELEDLKTKKVMEEREIKHLVKLKEEKLDVENQKKVLELRAEYNAMTMRLQEKYHQQQLGDLAMARKEMKEIYSEIMQRLPNITASLEMKKRG